MKSLQSYVFRSFAVCSNGLVGVWGPHGGAKCWLVTGGLYRQSLGSDGLGKLSDQRRDGVARPVLHWWKRQGILKRQGLWQGRSAEKPVGGQEQAQSQPVPVAACGMLPCNLFGSLEMVGLPICKVHFGTI